MPLMPAFIQHKDEAAMIGRLITGYGELEYLLAICAGTALASQHKRLSNHGRLQHRVRWERLATKRIFRVRGDDRIKRAKKIMYKSFSEVGLRSEYIYTMGAMSQCQKLRNLFAHCHWATSSRSGLLFVDLEDLGKQRGKFKFRFRRINAKALTEVEDHFWHTFQCLDYLAKAHAARADLTLFEAPTPPKKRPALPTFSDLFPKGRL